MKDSCSNLPWWRRRLMRSATLLGLLALSACATAPGYRSPAVQPPAAFRGMTDAARVAPAPYLATAPSATFNVASDYWERLGDTTLSRLVGEVLRANLDIRAARARVGAARADRVRSVLDLTPSAVVSSGYARQRLATASFPGASGIFP